MLPFRGLSVTFVHCAQATEDVNTIFFCPWQPIYISKILLQFDSHRSILSSPNSAPNCPPPVDMSVRGEWLVIAQWSQWRAYRKPPSLFRTVLSPSPKMGEGDFQDQFRDANVTEGPCVFFLFRFFLHPYFLLLPSENRYFPLTWVIALTTV